MIVININKSDHHLSLKLLDFTCFKSNWILDISLYQIIKLFQWNFPFVLFSSFFFKVTYQLVHCSMEAFFWSFLHGINCKALVKLYSLLCSIFTKVIFISIQNKNTSAFDRKNKRKYTHFYCTFTIKKSSDEKWWIWKVLLFSSFSLSLCFSVDDKINDSNKSELDETSYVFLNSFYVHISNFNHCLILSTIILYYNSSSLFDGDGN